MWVFFFVKCVSAVTPHNNNYLFSEDDTLGNASRIARYLQMPRLQPSRPKLFKRGLHSWQHGQWLRTPFDGQFQHSLQPGFPLMISDPLTLESSGVGSPIENNTIFANYNPKSSARNNFFGKVHFVIYIFILLFRPKSILFSANDQYLQLASIPIFE